MMKVNENTKKSIAEALKFGLIGAFNTFVDWGLFWVFLSVAGFDKNIAQILATAIAMTNSYFLNRYWTFNQKGKVQISEMGKFVVVNLVSLLVNLICLNLFSDVFKLHNIFNAILKLLNINFVLTGDLAIMFCKVCAVPFSLAVNFFGNKLWVFGKKEGK
ncbi:MAG: GtrA family protein [Clostridia bacterium]|nr:GtrA family protein [Clostridia bacterium]